MTGDRTISHPVHFRSGLAAEIAAIAEERLSRAGSSITTDPAWVRQFRAQVAAVIDEVAAELRQGRSHAFDPALSLAIGTSRAASGIPPAESLYAAQVLFEAALPVLTEAHSQGGGHPPGVSPADVALCLHRAILRRVVQGCLSYVDFLLARLRTSNFEERRRLARDLHDRVAHAVAIAMQQLELYGLYSHHDPDRAAACLESTREALRESVAVVKAVTTELRDTLDGQDLGAALKRYVDRCAPGLSSSVQIAGDPRALPQHVAEQLYLVLREAIHNAVLHADPSAVEVWVELGADTVTAGVADDGIGFPSQPSGGIGLSSMRERLELLGGTMAVRSVRGRGAEIRVSLPLAGKSR